jgi:hypothetical protein
VLGCGVIVDLRTLKSVTHSVQVETQFHELSALPAEIPANHIYHNIHYANRRKRRIRERWSRFLRFITWTPAVEVFA